MVAGLVLSVGDGAKQLVLDGRCARPDSVVLELELELELILECALELALELAVLEKLDEA